VSDTVIKVENLSKRYTIRHQGDSRDGLRHALESAFRNPRRWLRERQSSTQAKQEDFWALKDVSFEIKRGEVVGIIGRNGAGKSTLLKILSRITEPSQGRIRINGRVASLLEVGTGFHQELTGRENIFLNGAILGMSRVEIRRRFDEIVAFSEIEQFLDTPVKRYSSGMYVRLAFAVAAHLDPEILIVDEVLAVGDSEFQKKCMGRLSQVAHGGRTVLFVSHNMAAIKSLCTNGLILRKGSVLYRGQVGDCIARYSGIESTGTDLNWQRDSRLPSISTLGFEHIAGKIVGEQPALAIELECAFKSGAPHRDAMLAFDIMDSAGTPLMQAMPSSTPFLPYSRERQVRRISISLPPLVPGQYTVTAWAGAHHTDTYDEVRNAISFQVHASPTKGRTQPHSIDHGFIVPICSIIQ
jgi:lipopolysaccharide transport system ATP-binding protein